jgi:hypothetical protein
MPIIDNQSLYDKVKLEADLKYKKPSAYKSGWIVKRYKDLGGTYTNDNKPKNLKRWFKEDWKDVAKQTLEKSCGSKWECYPVFRPTIRVNKNTPLTPDEISPSNLVKQSILKQSYKGDKNLPPFKEKI